MQPKTRQSSFEASELEFTEGIWVSLPMVHPDELMFSTILKVLPLVHIDLARARSTSELEFTFPKSNRKMVGLAAMRLILYNSID